MAWLCADGVFVIVSTVGAPIVGSLPRYNTRLPCISNTLSVLYTFSNIFVNDSFYIYSELQNYWDIPVQQTVSLRLISTTHRRCPRPESSPSRSSPCPRTKSYLRLRTIHYRKPFSIGQLLQMYILFRIFFSQGETCPYLIEVIDIFIRISIKKKIFLVSYRL